MIHSSLDSGEGLDHAPPLLTGRYRVRPRRASLLQPVPTHTKLEVQIVDVVLRRQLANHADLARVATRHIAKLLETGTLYVPTEQNKNRCSRVF